MISAVDSAVACQSTTITQEDLEACVSMEPVETAIKEASIAGLSFVSIPTYMFAQTGAGCLLNILYLTRAGYVCSLEDELTLKISWLSPNPVDNTIQKESVIELAHTIWTNLSPLYENPMLSNETESQ